MKRSGVAAAALAAVLVALAAGDFAASAARRAGAADAYWIVFGSDRDGDSRAYSVRPDGSRLTPLFARGSKQYPSAMSGNGRTIAYDDPYEGGGISVSRANGSGLRKLVTDGGGPALSRDGTKLLFTFGFPPHIAVIGSDGDGRRQLTSGYDEEPDWSPNGKAIVFHRQFGEARAVIVVRPLQGSERVIVRGPGTGGPSSPKWSPNGRWIAYLRGTEGSSDEGLWVIRPDGTGAHRIARGDPYPFAWSPDGKTIAYEAGHPSDVERAGVDGKRSTLHLRLPRRASIGQLSWSPDGRSLAFEAGSSDHFDLWVVGADGRGLERVAKGGKNKLVGWTRSAPLLNPAAPLLPSERVMDTRTVKTVLPITDLSGDGTRAAFVVPTTGADCEHVVVWTPARRALSRFRKVTACPDTGVVSYGVSEVALAATRIAWSDIQGCGNFCDVALRTATLARPLPLMVVSENGGGGAGGGDLVNFNLHGHGNLVVFNDTVARPVRLVRLGAGSEKCGKALCTTLRSGVHAAPIDSVAGGLIAIREVDAVSVLDARGELRRVFPFGPNEVRAARLDDGRLVVARAGVLEVYDVATGAGVLQRTLPPGFALEDVDGGIAVLRDGKDAIMLLRLADERSLTLTPGRAPRNADLEQAGLYYSYATADGGGRVVFAPRAEVERRLGL